MNELRAFLNNLSLQEQRDFSKRCGTTIAYLRKSISKGSVLGTEICVLIEKESNNVVTRKHLVPNWKERWPELAEN
ncbi:MAG: Cro/Cl family transcriptional regulator [Pasteurellaceae bacterium]|nr:Cro/Cl family transcriptional regulator [Pasteurellaceae bacterium]